MSESFDFTEHRLDAATSRRLARLADRPVDTASLERRLAGALADEPAPAKRAAWRRSARPLQAAAVVTLLVVAGWLVVQASTPAVAAPGALAQIHRQMLAEELDTMPVTSIEAANAAIASRWSQAPAIPEAPGARVLACCLHELDGARLALVRLEYDDAMVKLVVARSRDLRSPPGRTVVRDGRDYVIHEHGGVTMVMKKDGGRWLCVMGELPEDDLLAIAGRIEF